MDYNLNIIKYVYNICELSSIYNTKMNITSDQIRAKFLDFMETKWHKIIPSAPLVPENDPTALFNVAGMQPLVPYLMGEKHPLGTRLADAQKCIRTNDIEEVWDDSHLTFFEMLGNWSLWDYFKKDSINYSYELLTSPDWFWIDPNKIAVTVFEGDNDAPRDMQSAEIWKEVWMPESRISFLPKSENWWAAWDTGPCGPDTEIFYWVWKSQFPPEGSNVETDESNWMEIWNNVFMEYEKKADWSLVKLPAQNVDTGMWIERITTILNWEISVYHTDIFIGITNKIVEVLWVERSPERRNAIRIIADHSRTATMLISDWVFPSNTEQWYILRRLMRRAIRQAYSLGYKGQFMSEIAKVVIEKLWNIYPNLVSQKDRILEEIDREEKQFLSTLEKGLKEFEKLLAWFEIAFERSGKKIEVIAWAKAFKLYDTYGFPLEMTRELAAEKNLTVDEQGFHKAFEKHQELSRAWSEQKFKWWLADDSEASTELHSATHLLLAGLNKVLGWDIHQKWSNITPERLRFDFNYDEKVSRELLDEVETFVNEAIQSGLSIEMQQMDKEEARNSWVEWSFWEKYPDTVKVYSMTGWNGVVYSKELCGWPHIETSSKMWTFKIKKEQASSRGVRRIKAILIK